jgi:hypothetical protein
LTKLQNIRDLTKPGIGGDKGIASVAPNTLQINTLRKPPAATGEQEVIVKDCASED